MAGCAVPVNTVRWTPALFNTAVQLQAAEESWAPVSSWLIIGWQRWGEWGGRRWTLRTIPQPQLSCQLPLTHCCQVWPCWNCAAKENSPSLHLLLAVSLDDCLPPTQAPTHPLFTACSRLRQTQHLKYVLKTAHNPQPSLIKRPYSPITPALHLEEVKFISIHILSCNPQALDAEIHSPHIHCVPLGFFPGLLNPYLCRLFKVSCCSAQEASQRRAWISPHQLRLAPAAAAPAAQTRPPSPRELQISASFTFTTPKTPLVQKQLLIIFN